MRLHKNLVNKRRACPGEVFWVDFSENGSDYLVEKTGPQPYFELVFWNSLNTRKGEKPTFLEIGSHLVFVSCTVPPGNCADNPHRFNRIFRQELANSKDTFVTYVGKCTALSKCNFSENFQTKREFLAPI